MPSERAERAAKRRRLSPADQEEGSRKTSKRKSTANQSSSSSTSKAKTTSKTPENVQTDSTAVEELPAVKGLDSSDASTRRKTLTTVLSHLQDRPAQHPLSKTQCLQLWRGFHVAIYMHDSKNALSVQNLLRDIAGTFSTMSHKDNELSESDKDRSLQCPWFVPYHEAFWETMVREWAHIDSHRMNKYLLLIRLVMRQLFVICIDTPATAATDPSTEIETELELRDAHTKSIVTTLSTIGPLNSKDIKIPNGLRLHVLDVWVDELCYAFERADEGNMASTERAKQVIIDHFITPVNKISASNSGAQKVVRQRSSQVIKDIGERIDLEGLELTIV